MTLEKIIEMLYAHLQNKQAAYSFAMSRVDVAEALMLESEINVTRHTLSLLEKLKSEQ